MGLFSKKTKDDGQKPKTKAAVKPAKVESAKPIVAEKESMKELYDGPAKPAVKKTTVAGKEEKVEKKTSTGRAYHVLVKPLITEKATNLSTENKYVFAVNVDSNKIEIAKAIKSLYGIDPIAVNVVNMRGKKSSYRRMKGRRKDWKKAIVTLPEGKTIKIYEGI